MLKLLRKKDVAKRILYVLAGIIIVAFVFLSPGSIIRGPKSTNYAGIVFGKKISFNEYKDNLLAIKNQALIRFGENFYAMQKFINFQKETWDRIILFYEAKRRKIKVSNKEVIETIKQYPFLQTNGKFDPELYNNVLNYFLKTSARKFEEETRQSLMLEKLYDQITKGVSLSDEEVLNNYKKTNEKIKLAYVRFLTKDFIKDVSVKDDELKKYFDEHASEFKKPETVNIQYLGMDYPKDASEEDKDAIDEKFIQIYENFNNETDLQKISEQNSLQIKETGFFGILDTVPALGLNFQFNQVAFSLKEKQISQPVKTNSGIYILKLKEKKDSYIPNFEEAKKSVEETLKNKNAAKLAEDKAKEYLAKLEELYKNNPAAIDFKKSAESEELTYNQTPLFSYEEYVPDIGISKSFSDEAFALRDTNKIFGFASSDRGSFILKLEEFVPIDEEKFKKEEEDYKEKLLQKKKDLEFNKFFIELKDKAQLIDNISELETNQQ